MLNDFIGGGQVFLHKLQMLFQVLRSSFTTSLLVSVTIVCVISYKPAQLLDLRAAMTYQKALLADNFDDAGSFIRNAINPVAQDYYTKIDAYDKKGLYAKDIDSRKILKSPFYRASYLSVWEFVKIRLALTVLVMSGIFILIYLLWSRFGKDVKAEKQKDGSSKVLTSKEVRKCLRKIGKASDLTIGDMPLVKDMETRHVLITGATGAGKTTLMHNLLLQVEAKKQPAIIIDQTGEMIAKYYNPSRGDIIFNPFDQRGKAWDFWRDCESREDLERFSKILIGFNRKQSSSHSDLFWETAAETVLNSCVEFLRGKNASVQDVANMACHADIEYLKTVLKDTEGSRYLTSDSKQTSGSIVAVLAANSKPLMYLQPADDNGYFSIKQYFANLQTGNKAWLFLATKPSSRALTLPLISCLTELALTGLMEIGIDSKRRVWIVIDELPALGKLPALSPLMAEGRKYGACVLAGMQSLNQLYSQYGHYDGSAIFGQFGTSFFFRNLEPAIAKMISSMCGSQTLMRQQKNTSFGAHEFRDGVSYNEQHHKQNLIAVEDLANLSVGECYTLLPEPRVRLSKMQIPAISLPNKNLELIPKKLISSSNNSANQSANNPQDSSRSPSAPNHSVSQKSKQQKNIKKIGKKKPTQPKEVELESKAADLL
jgi:type IV conjugative transfer system coupling protein TraD